MVVSHRQPRRTDCDKLISGDQRVQIAENREGFKASPKMNLLYFYSYLRESAGLANAAFMD